MHFAAALLTPTLWPKLHGASSHFPIALTLLAAACEAAAFFVPDGTEGKTRRSGLRAAGYYAIAGAALGTVPAVLSGLVMTRGSTMGHDLLLWHHLFVWPSFAVIVTLGVWRVRAGEAMAEDRRKDYLVILLAAAVLISLAGYWGGEMIVAG